MAALIPENFETVAPSEADAMLARESSRLLATHKLGRRASVRIRLLDDGDEAETVSVPTSAVRLFLHLLTEMSQGNYRYSHSDPRGTDDPAGRRSAQRVSALYRQTARRGQNPVRVPLVRTAASGSTT